MSLPVCIGSSPFMFRTLFFLFIVSDNISLLQTVPKELDESERSLIVRHLKDRWKAEEYDPFFFFHLQGKPPLFIKSGGYDVLAEAGTQHFFYILALNDPSAPRIPKVFDAFCLERKYFLVMEKIDWPTVEECIILEKDAAVERVASAVEWLLDQMPLVPRSVFGRITSEEGACVFHRFFKDHQAPAPFVNSDALLKYVVNV